MADDKDRRGGVMERHFQTIASGLAVLILFGLYSSVLGVEQQSAVMSTDLEWMKKAMGETRDHVRDAMGSAEKDREESRRWREQIEKRLLKIEIMSGDGGE